MNGLIHAINKETLLKQTFAVKFFQNLLFSCIFIIQKNPIDNKKTFDSLFQKLYDWIKEKKLRILQFTVELVIQ